MAEFIRPGKSEGYLAMAEAASMRSTCLRRRYGAIIVKDDIIVATGYNGSARGEENCIDINACAREELNIPKGERYELCVAVHAEQNAIISADRDKMLNSTMYVVGLEVSTNGYADGKPCVICARMIKNAGISKVVVRNNEGGITEYDVLTEL